MASNSGSNLCRCRCPSSDQPPSSPPRFHPSSKKQAATLFSFGPFLPLPALARALLPLTTNPAISFRGRFSIDLGKKIDLPEPQLFVRRHCADNLINVHCVRITHEECLFVIAENEFWQTDDENSLRLLYGMISLTLPVRRFELRGGCKGFEDSQLTPLNFEN
jgi:hypothetical protein